MPLTIRPYRRSLRIASLCTTLIFAAVILEPCLYEFGTTEPKGGIMTYGEALSLAVGLSALFVVSYLLQMSIVMVCVMVYVMVSRWHLSFRKCVMVGTDNQPYHSVVWVTVGMVQLPRTLWTYWLSEDKRGSPSSGPLLSRGNPTDMLCYSYTELSTCLRIICGHTPPPPDYFMPTHKELNQGAKWFLRSVVRLR